MKVTSFRLKKKHTPLVVLGVAVLVFVMFSAILIPGRQIRTTAQLPEGISGGSNMVQVNSGCGYGSGDWTRPQVHRFTVSPLNLRRGDAFSVDYDITMGTCSLMKIELKACTYPENGCYYANDYWGGWIFGIYPWSYNNNTSHKRVSGQKSFVIDTSQGHPYPQGAQFRWVITYYNGSSGTPSSRTYSKIATLEGSGTSTPTPSVIPSPTPTLRFNTLNAFPIIPPRVEGFLQWNLKMNYNITGLQPGNNIQVFRGCCSRNPFADRARCSVDVTEQWCEDNPSRWLYTLASSEEGEMCTQSATSSSHSGACLGGLVDLRLGASPLQGIFRFKVKVCDTSFGCIANPNPLAIGYSNIVSLDLSSPNPILTWTATPAPSPTQTPPTATHTLSVSPPYVQFNQSVTITYGGPKDSYTSRRIRIIKPTGYTAETRTVTGTSGTVSIPIMNYGSSLTPPGTWRAEYQINTYPNVYETVKTTPFTVSASTYPASQTTSLQQLAAPQPRVSIWSYLWNFVRGAR